MVVGSSPTVGAKNVNVKNGQSANFELTPSVSMVCMWAPPDLIGKVSRILKINRNSRKAIKYNRFIVVRL